eukprot:CAMPEP_0168732148 /NCGR_PEP_ID=MMETSP0724-20121128/7626_1 /TAXON_ID=265536 /ORGANISM="Amphiprora sp., Strain CCMP467" /LENGTH=1248 /DNA_ID=CAMNT_0008779167 /DNA_START=54 /DNA_END=3801 /DNA_ORIENTATION=+
MSSSGNVNSYSQEDAANLKALLTALAAGARAVQALPLSKDGSSSNNNNSSQDKESAMDDDDAFAFESSFPEFSAALARAQESERAVLIGVLKEISTQTDVLEYDDALAADGTQTAVLYEHCATACELLLEQVEVYLQDALPSRSTNINNTADARQQLSSWSQTARQKSTSQWATILASTVAMEKPQVTYQMAPPCNGRTQVFVPPFQENHPNLQRLPGHGYDSCLASPESLAGKHFQLLPQTTQGQQQATKNMIPSNKQYPPNVVAPTEHVQHLYQDDILAFCPIEWELEPLLQRPTSPLPAVTQLQATWIDTPEALEALGQRLNQSNNSSDNNSNAAIPVIALDLEAHSYRSFSGMVCLMQLSFVETTGSNNNNNNRIDQRTTETHNFLIDTLKLKASDIHRTLQPALANPSIVKLLHGADSDVQWLQRDFGLYLVHLWDTGRAARALNFSSASYAYLLQRYCLPASGEDGDTNLVSSIVQNKQKFQLADWRQRPVPQDMQQYAIADTHFLIYIAHHLKWELQQPLATSNNTGASMLHVLDTSRLVSLSRYPGPSLFLPTGYQTLLSSTGKRRKRGTNKRQQHQHSYTPLQQHVLSVLWDWRDATAREMDESLFYICPNHVLQRLAMSMPKEAPLPGNLSLPHGEVLESKIVAMISQAVADFAKSNPREMEASQQLQKEQQQEDLDDYDGDNNTEMGGEDLQMKADEAASPSKKKVSSTSKSSAFFKPAAHAKDRQRRGMMSPVMGTEALYKQAGWMTPEEEAASLVTSNESTPATGEDTGEDDEAAVEDINTTASEGETSVGSPRRTGMGMVLDTASAPPSLDLKPAASSGGSNPVTPRRSVDGFASSRAAREASKSPGKPPPGLEDDANEARQSSAQIRSDLLENHHMNVLGLLTAVNAAEGGDEQDPNEEDEPAGSAKSRDQPATTKGEEDFDIPRSMREIYKISNRNRKFKKTGSEPPERAPAPTSEKELSELQKAEALLRERGMDEAGFLFAPSKTNSNNSSTGGDVTKRGNNNSSKSRKQQDGNNNPGDNKNNDTNKDRDMAFFRGIGWIPQQDTDLSVMSECYGSGADHGAASGRGSAVPAEGNMHQPPIQQQQQQLAPSAYPPPPYYYSQPMGGPHAPPPQQMQSLNQPPASNNPFFAGAALQGGPLTQNFRNETSAKSFRSSNNNNNSGTNNKGNNNNTRSTGKSRSRTSERPEKREEGVRMSTAAIVNVAAGDLGENSIQKTIYSIQHETSFFGDKA